MIISDSLKRDFERKWIHGGDDRAQAEREIATTSYCFDGTGKLKEIAATPAPAQSQLNAAQTSGTSPPVAFLQQWPTYPTLTAIFTDPTTGEKGKIETKSFPDRKWAEIEKWIADRNGKANLYFLVNPTRAPKDSKADRTDIAALVALHVDVDVRAGEDQVAGIERIVKTFEAYKTPPSVITTSGGGAQAFWLLETPLALDGTLEAAEDAKLFNVALERELAGDHCHNIDRIMRLPGTWNIPNAAKIKKGRVTALATLRFIDVPRKWGLEKFSKSSPDKKDSTTTVAKTKTESAESVSLKFLQDAGVKQDILDLIAFGPQDAIGKGGQTLGRGGIDFKVVSALARACLSDGQIKGAYKLGKIGSDEAQWPRGFDGDMDRIIANVRAKMGDEVSAVDHMARAASLIGRKHPNLKHYRDDFMDFDAGRYAMIADSTLFAEFYSQLSNCTKRTTDKKGVARIVPFYPDTKSVNETLNAARAACHVAPAVDQPCWLDGRTSPNPADLISFRNGFLNLVSREFLPHDVNLFTPFAVGIDFDKDAGEPVEWKKFLNDVFGGEQDQIESLQEAFGYCMSQDVSQEKGFMTIGPKRSGKDTMRNVLQALLPSGAVAGPTLDSLVTNFGLSSLINKTLAIVGDMRIGKKTDKELLAENVLKLTGRGWFTIDRKNKSHWDGFLPCKLWLISNDRPAFTDTSGALASRFIIFRTRNSFFGFENPNLFRDKLKPELGGILLWALEGLRRVRARGKLSEPQSSIEERDALAREGSPVMAFVAERLTLDANATLDKDELRAAYNSWAEANGFYLKTKDRLMRDLVSATGGKVHAAKVWQGKGDDARQVPVAKGASLIATQHTGGDDGLPF